MQWSKLFHCSSKSFGTNFSLFTTPSKNRFCFAASSSSGKDGDSVEMSEGETAPRVFTWPDKKVGLLLI